MINPWLFVSNDVLVNIYRKSIGQKGDKDLIDLVFQEIKNRNLRVDKPRHIKRIK
ncbi:sporulation histidine kinase inhibitor Sda [Virgibacillus salexigens]|uniref:sporulation histidine kinase inhibitor Sda n=1 Tax=Virgibacillus salexigens TaxID=61016 RepID=UPI00190BBCBD